MLGLLTVVPGMSFKFAYLIWKLACLKSMVASLEHVIGKFELEVDVIPLSFKSPMLVVNVAVVLNLCNGIPTVLIGNGLAEGVKGMTRTCEKIVEPGWHRVGCVRCIIEGEVEVSDEGLLILTLPNQEVDMSIITTLDPLGISISSTNGNLGVDIACIWFETLWHLNVVSLVLKGNSELADLVAEAVAILCELQDGDAMEDFAVVDGGDESIGNSMHSVIRSKDAVAIELGAVDESK